MAKWLTTYFLLSPEWATVINELNNQPTTCDVCGKTERVIDTTYESIEVRVPDPAPGHGLTITTRGNVFQECYEPDHWTRTQERVRRMTVDQYEAGLIRVPLN